MSEVVISDWLIGECSAKYGFDVVTKEKGLTVAHATGPLWCVGKS